MRRTIAPVLLSLALVGVACSDDDDDGGDASTFCEQRAELRDSVQELRDVNVVEEGVEALDTQLDEVLAEVTDLRASAGELAPEVDAVKAAADSLKTSVAAASTLPDKASALVAGLTDLSASWDALTTASDADCG